MPKTRSSEDVVELIQRLTDPDHVDVAITELAEQRLAHADLGPMLWERQDVMIVLADCIVGVYPNLSKLSSLTLEATNRACGALALFQIMVAHPDSRQKFLDGGFLKTVFPLVKANGNDVRIDGLRTTSLGVVASLVKTSNVDEFDPALVAELKSLCKQVSPGSSEQCQKVARYVRRKLKGRDLARKPQPQSRGTAAASQEAPANVCIGLPAFNIGSEIRDLKNKAESSPSTSNPNVPTHCVWGDVEPISDYSSQNDSSWSENSGFKQAATVDAAQIAHTVWDISEPEC